MNPGIFKAYDIRGVYPEEIDEQAVRNIARGFAALLQAENPGKKLKVAVGMDMRLSSPNLKEEAIEGLIESGADADDLGLVSTPTFYFGTAYYGYDGGLQISASHNPKQYNGVKLVRRGAGPVSKDSGIFAIRDMIVGGKLPPPATAPGRRGERLDAVDEEVVAELAFAAASAPHKFKIVIDAANGMGALDMAALFRHLPGEIVEMNFALDGTFPAHEADPLKPENVKDLCARVAAEHADLGIATDGDGDRIFIVDGKGEIMPPHILRGVMAQIELKDNPGATVAYDIRPGRITADMIAELGGKPVITPVGHSLIKEMMIKEGAIFGGESSGHFFYAMPFGTFEAPMVLVAKFLAWLSEQNKPLSAAIAPYKRYAHSGEINFKLKDRAAIEAKIEEIKTKFADGKQIYIDGVTVEYPDYWFNVRASNTEPLLRLTVEARNQEVLNRELPKLKQLISG